MFGFIVVNVLGFAVVVFIVVFVLVVVVVVLVSFKIKNTYG